MTNRVKIAQSPLEITHRPRATATEQSRQAYALFRQALAERSPLAWEKLYTQYWPLVLSWVQREPSFALSGQEAQDFANQAFEKMWHSITPVKFAKFADLPAILKYLRLCVRSVVIDETRREQRRQLGLHAVIDEYRTPDDDVEQEYCSAAQQQEFWTYVQARLKNEKELQLLHYRFVLGIKPNRICEQYRDTFANPDEVYTMIQNILARLRRDPALQDFVLC